MKMETRIATQVRGQINPGCSVNDEFVAAAYRGPEGGCAPVLMLSHPPQAGVTGPTGPFPTDQRRPQRGAVSSTGRQTNVTRGSSWDVSHLAFNLRVLLQTRVRSF